MIPFTPPLPPTLLTRTRHRKNPLLDLSLHPLLYCYAARVGIWHAIDVLGLQPGDEVLMPAYHHGIESEVLRHRGLIPRYYGIDRRLRFDLTRLEQQLSPRTRLLYVIHYFGIPQPVDALSVLARRHELPLFEDCALALFGRLPDGRPLGGFGDVSIFCLNKFLPVPHGGALRINDPDLGLAPDTRSPPLTVTLGQLLYRFLDQFQLTSGRAGEALSSVLHRVGRRIKGTGRFDAAVTVTENFNPRIVDLAPSALATRILERIDAVDVVAKRRRNYAVLLEHLDPGVREILGPMPEGACPLALPILVPDKPAMHHRLLGEGLETANFWYWDRPDIPVGTFPDVDFLRRHLLAVPVHQGLREHHMMHIAGLLNRFARGLDLPD